MSHFRRELGMLVALLLMCAGLYASNPDFLGQSNIGNTSRQVAMLGTYSVGSAMVIITGGIDLSVGSIIGLTGVLLAKLSSPVGGCCGYSLWVGIPIAVGVATLVGLAQGLLITLLDLQPFIVTLGGMLLIRGVSQTIAGGGTLGFGDSTFPQLADGGIFYYHGNPLVSYPVLIFIAVALVGAYVLHFTVFGRYLYAIGGNRDASAYSGINVRKVETLAYVISAATAGIAGICYAAYIGQMSQQVGIAYELYAIAAVVLGGVSLRGGEGTILGVVIGSAVMRVIDNGINMFQFRYKLPDGHHRIWRLDPNWNFIIIGAVILVAVVLDQLAHAIQSRRRIRRAGAAAPPSTPASAPAIAAPPPG